MKNRFAVNLSVMLAVSSLAAVAANLNAEVDKAVRELYGRKEKGAPVPYTKLIPELESLRDSPRFATNVQARLRFNRAIVTWARLPCWPDIRRYDRAYVLPKMREVCSNVLADASCPADEKVFFATTLALHLCGEGQPESGARCLKQVIGEMEAIAKRTPFQQRILCDAYTGLADVARLQEDRQALVKAIDAAYACEKARATAAGVTRAASLGGMDDVIDSWWKRLDNPYEELRFYSKDPKTRLAKAEAFCLDDKVGSVQRAEICADYFMRGRTDVARRTIAAVGTLDLSRMGGNLIADVVRGWFQCGGYDKVVEIKEAFAKGKPPKCLLVPGVERLYIVSLGAVGRRDDGARYADERARDADLKPTDALRYRVYAAMLRGEDPLGVIEAASDCSRREKMEVTLSAARQAQIWNMTDAAEKCSAKYETYFAKSTPRSLAVSWSDERLSNITVWRRLEGKFEKQLCDRPFRGSMEFLETDVNAKRTVDLESTEDAPGFVALSAAADVDGLHVFLQVKDANARRIESGFAEGTPCEMYFAPGPDEPYASFGTTAREGVTFTMNTLYASADHERIGEGKRPHPNVFRSETQFSDDDYVCHLFFPWDDYCNKLPSASRPWKFECISWTSKGGMSWGGSQGIHEASSWGDLRIELSPAQMLAVKRALLFRHAKTWRHISLPGTSADIFDMWSDDEIGDRAFHDKVLVPLRDELLCFAAKIRPDMTDDEVDEVFDKAFLRMKGLKHEIDRLRKQYLLEQASKGL